MDHRQDDGYGSVPLNYYTENESETPLYLYQKKKPINRQKKRVKQASKSRLDRLHLRRKIPLDAPPKLLAELDPSYSSQADGQEQPAGPRAGDDEARREEREVGPWHHERGRGSRGGGGGGFRGGRGRVGGAGLREDAVDEGGFG